MADDDWYLYPTDEELAEAIDPDYDGGTFVDLGDGEWAWFGNQADAELAAASATELVAEIHEDFETTVDRGAPGMRAADGSDLDGLDLDGLDLDGSDLDGSDLYADSDYDVAEYVGTDEDLGAGADQDLDAGQGLSI